MVQIRLSSVNFLPQESDFKAAYKNVCRCDATKNPNKVTPTTQNLVADTVCNYTSILV